MTVQELVLNNIAAVRVNSSEGRRLGFRSIPLADTTTLSHSFTPFLFSFCTGTGLFLARAVISPQHPPPSSSSQFIRSHQPDLSSHLWPPTYLTCSDPPTLLPFFHQHWSQSWGGAQGGLVSWNVSKRQNLLLLSSFWFPNLAFIALIFEFWSSCLFFLILPGLI